MREQKFENDNKRIRRVTYLGIVVNVALAVVKLAVGMAAGSMALFADGVHSFSDLATDVAVLLGVSFGSKGPDSKHPYGHGRIETFSSVFVALALVFVGGAMIYKASRCIAGLDSGIAKEFVLGPGVVIVAVISVLSKEVLYWLTKMVAVKSHSTALYANAWHHRSDALSSVAVLVGFASIRFGYVYGDQLAAVAVGLMIMLVGIKIMGKCFEEFSEGAVDSGTIDQITRIIESNEKILKWHKLRTRNVGREVFIDMHILVDAGLNIVEAHDIAEELEDAMHKQIVRPVNITVHVEPDVDKPCG
ncbi:MAG: cation transporter [Planctomycetes bacterium]|nr:cation transporter [Planctomycetota bacterium]